MFFGTTPACIREYLAKVIREHRPNRVIEPCAGNFALSLVVGAVDKSIPIISGDVSIYSVALGCAFEGRDSGIRLVDGILDDYPFWRGKESPDEIAAIMLVMMEVAKLRAKQETRYYGRMLRIFERNLEATWGETLKKVETARESLPEEFRFFGQDCVETIQHVQEDDLVLYDPPYFAGDYENMFRELNECFTWEPIRYTEINEELRHQHMIQMAETGARVYHRPENDIEVPGFEKVFEYEYKADKSYRLYNNTESMPGAGKRELMPSTDHVYDVLYGDELWRKAKVEIVKTDGRTSNHFRLAWSRKALLRDTGDRFLIVIGGKVCGVLAITSGLAYGSPYAVIISDAVPLHTPYNRLSQLPLCIALSDEFLQRYNDFSMWEHVGFTTKAYTNNQSSMKYRKLFEKIKVENSKLVGKTNQNFEITYRCEQMKFRTVKQAYQFWFDKYAADVTLTAMHQKAEIETPKVTPNRKRATQPRG